MNKLNTQYNKALAGGITGGGTSFVATLATIQMLAQNLGWIVTEWQAVAIAGGIATVFGAIQAGVVWRVPNKVVDPEMHTIDNTLDTQEMDIRKNA